MPTSAWLLMHSTRFVVLFVATFQLSFICLGGVISSRLITPKAPSIDNTTTQKLSRTLWNPSQVHPYWATNIYSIRQARSHTVPYWTAGSKAAFFNTGLPSLPKRYLGYLFRIWAAINNTLDTTCGTDILETPWPAKLSTFSKLIQYSIIQYYLYPHFIFIFN